jgi:hypothetical protein
MNKLLTPSIELLKEISDNLSAFEFSVEGDSIWFLCSEAAPISLLTWACGGDVQIRRKQWTPEVGKLIAVRDARGQNWSFGVFDSISRDGLYVVNRYRWSYARPVLPEELSK